jgi:polyisoprenoid-binding protein YceI
MNKKHLSLIFLLLANCAFAQIKQTLSKSSVTFQIKNLGFNTGGSIDVIHADIQFDSASLLTSSITATADMTTLNTDNDMRDEHLKSGSFFDVPDYPKITMKSVSFKHKGGDSYTGQFELTIKKTTKLVEVPFTYTETGNSASFKGSFNLKRSDFGIGSSSLSLSDNVTADIDIETTK